ncbi:hypothetical protein BH24ACT21_BH24ACT21_04430 [soil metagenome]|jgi:hypothetical protein
MSEEPKLRAYGQGEYVVLKVVLHDKTGISTVQASAVLQAERKPLTDLKANTELAGKVLRVDLQDEARGERQANVELTGRISTQPPGIYVCRSVVAWDVYGQATEMELDPPRRFEIVEDQDRDLEGPEIISVSDFL